MFHVTRTKCGREIPLPHEVADSIGGEKRATSMAQTRKMVFPPSSHRCTRPKLSPFLLLKGENRPIDLISTDIRENAVTNRLQRAARVFPYFRCEKKVKLIA